MYNAPVVRLKDTASLSGEEREARDLIPLILSPFRLIVIYSPALRDCRVFISMRKGGDFVWLL